MKNDLENRLRQLNDSYFKAGASSIIYFSCGASLNVFPLYTPVFTKEVNTLENEINLKHQNFSKTIFHSARL
jgi:fructoselysine-6-P-deglycase FrlB-like protein